MKVHLMRKFIAILIFSFSFLLADSYFQSIKDAGYQYLYPHPNSTHVSVKSKILIRLQNQQPQNILNLENFITLTGNKKKGYSGTTSIASDGRTILFRPDEFFIPGEKIRVELAPRFSTGQLYYQYVFYVSDSEFGCPVIFPDEANHDHPLKSNSLAKSTQGQARVLSNGVSIPSDFPEIDITVNNDPDSSLIFINHRDYPTYQMILNNDGEPEWYRKVNDNRRDFKLQSNGQITMMTREGGDGYLVFDYDFEYDKTIRASNGYWLDEHELLMLPDSGYFIIGRREETVDMSEYGKPADATVRENCIQEYTKDDELIFQWAAWDHFDPADLDYAVNGNDNYIRFPHMNAVFIDDDGHILLSSRHLSEVTKINRQTGKIIWRLSGENNQFDFLNDDLQGFRNQHAVRATGNNCYTVFDNGNSHNPSQSRAVEYKLDTDNMTAEIIWEFRNDRSQYYSWYMGNTQRLPNGNTLINWAIGQLPKLSEITPDGEKAYEMTFADGCHVYRTFKMDWNGAVRRPYLMTEVTSSHLTLLFNKFGDNDVDYYNIYGSESPNPTTLLDTSKATMKKITELENKYYYFRVTAVNREGEESDFSNEEGVSINFIDPGNNMIKNGDFESGGDHWIWEVFGEATASWSVEDGISYINIGNGGNEYYNVQLRQNGIPLTFGVDYVLEFDARAEASRIVEIKVGQDTAPWIDYSKIGYSALSTQTKHFEYPFTMENASDNNARVVINCGTVDTDIYIDNVVVKAVVENEIEESPTISTKFRLLGNYPNPFNNQTNIRYVLPHKVHVILTIYDINGELTATREIGRQAAGTYDFNLETHGWASSIYFYQVEAVSGQNIVNTKTGKMILIK